LFSFTKDPINSENLKKSLQKPENGALVIFDGIVRDHSEGKSVSSLEYEGYEALALNEAENIFAEAKKLFSFNDAVAVHRLGHLDIKDSAVCIIVSSAHRKEAFEACQYIINAIKHRLPIWKKEHYTNGDAKWVSCAGCQAEIAIDKSSYYSRQEKLPQFANQGQKYIEEGSVLVIGAGGLGCPALSYLVGAGVGRIGICDGDTIDATNLHRQVLYSCSDLNKKKASTAKKALSSLNPFVEIEVHNEAVNPNNLESLISGYDVILDCTDNLKAKYLIHDAAFLQKKPLVSAAVYQCEAQVQVFHTPESSACLRCQSPQMPEPSCVGNCADVGVLGATTGIVGSWQAMEALKILLGVDTVLDQEMLLIDCMSAETRKIQRKHNEHCPLCGIHPTINAIFSQNYEANCEIRLESLEASEYESYRWIDIREDHERHTQNPWELATEHFPSSRYGEITEFNKTEKLMLICHRGIRSLALTKKLRELGYNESYSCVGGMKAFQEYWESLCTLSSS
jgi:molybdopterin/thiamine biosynthesis adenylyltransferase/molybdopterin synthase catalytic subunit/rhodanese-related sulfurtransferase